MQWRGRRSSDNVEDMRGGGGNRNLLAGGGIGTLIIAALIYFMGGDPTPLLQNAGTVTNTQQQTPYTASGEEQELASFVGVVLADTEDVWNKIFTQMGENYVQPKLVLFTGQVQSACGGASSAMGPFYCPANQKAYIDLSFYSELKNKLGGGGDFAMAYVIAHEIGHHVQNLLGTNAKLQQARSQLSEAAYNKLSVALELQADFYAGVWAHHTQQQKNVLEEGDIQEAMKTAAAIGDDKLQMQTQGYTVPDAFTHGTSEQRMKWFQLGFETGDIKKGNTFAGL